MLLDHEGELLAGGLAHDLACWLGCHPKVTFALIFA
jgi:hypothetical protein